MSSNCIVEHRKDYFYLEFREEYLIICMNCKYKKPVKEGTKCKSSPHCKAFILAILERWTDTKRKKGEDLAIYMTYPQWVEELQGLFGRNAIIDSLDELIGEGLISRDKHKMYGKDTYKYLLNYKELNRRIKLLPQGKAFTNKRDETPETVTNQSEAFTNKPDSRLQVNEDAFTKGRNIESNIDSVNTDSERKDGSTSDSPPESSFTHPSTPSQSSSEVIFTEEETQVLNLAKKLRLSYLSKNEKNKAHCSKLVLEGITTLEQMKSLMQFCRQRPYLKSRDLNLGNLAGELDGWLQLQKPPADEPTRASVLVSEEQKQRNIEKLRTSVQKEGITL